MQRYSLSQLEVLGTIDPGGTVPSVCHPLFGVIGETLHFIQNPNDEDDEQILPFEPYMSDDPNALTASARQGHILLFEQPLSPQKGYVVFVAENSSHPEYLSPHEAAQRITAFVTDHRNKGDAAFRSNNNHVALAEYILTASASECAEDYARILLAKKRNDEVDRPTYQIMVSAAKSQGLDPDMVLPTVARELLNPPPL